MLVVANPANTNACVAAKVAKSIPSTNFTCLTRLDEERLKNLLVKKLNSSGSSTATSSDIKDVFILGNHSATQVPIVEMGTVEFGSRQSKISELFEPSWLSDELTTSVQQRGASVMNAQGASSAMSAASAIAKHLQDWLGFATTNSELFSMVSPLDDFL